MKNALSFISYKFNSLAVLGFVIIAGCSQALDTRPIVGEPAFGLSFKGTLVSVAPARSEFHSESIYPEFAAALGREGSRIAGTDGFDARGDVFAAGAAALTSNAERLLRSTRCIYFFSIDNKQIENVILDILLFREVETDIIDQRVFDGVPRIFSLSQSCDPNLIPGEQALFSYTGGSGTIHPLSSELQAPNAIQNVLDNSANAGFRPIR